MRMPWASVFMDTEGHHNCLIVLPLHHSNLWWLHDKHLDVRLPCFCSLVLSDIFDLHRAGILFFIMIPVPRRPFAFNISCTLTGISLLSKYRCVPRKGRCHPSMDSPWSGLSRIQPYTTDLITWQLWASFHNLDNICSASLCPPLSEVWKLEFVSPAK